MVMKAVGVKPQSRFGQWSSNLAWHMFDRRRRQMQAEAPSF
jgi:hypothetical protein